MKIILTESQLKFLIEQPISPLLNANPITNVKEDDPFFGSLLVKKNDGSSIRIRLYTDSLGDVNVVNVQNLNDGSVKIVTKKGTVKTLKKDVVKKFLDFINSNEKVTNEPLTGNLLANIYAKKL